MTKENIKNTGQQKSPPPVETDAGARSISEALKISFMILKLIMIALVIFFLASGFKTIKTGERAIILRFGKIHGRGEGRILKPRTWPYWVLPYPIDQFIKIPVEKTIDLNIDSFWYFQTEEQKLSSEKRKVPPDVPLNPLVDGYSLTRSEPYAENLRASGDSDYNILHSRWKLTCQISDPESFFKNVYTQDIKSGEKYIDVIKRDLTDLLTDVVDSSVVTAMVNYTIDEAFEKGSMVSDHVKDLVQKKLDQMESGIRVISVQRIDVTWPLQVDDAFQASITASQTKQTEITDAINYAQNTLNETAGPVAAELAAALHNKDANEAYLESLWSALAGRCQEIISQAGAYRRKVVSDASANANYLTQILPEYQKRPQLVVQAIYKNAIARILTKADEKILIEPAKSDKGSVIYIKVNRDPKLVNKPKEKTQE